MSNGFLGRRHVVEGAETGPLAGLTFAVKDVFDLAGRRAGAGHPIWRACGPAPDAHAEVVARLLEAGATCVGTTISDPLAFSLVGENALDGTPINPRASDRIVGGSSCGSAAVCANGLVDFALGTDTAGSIRVPASHCALFGLRPTHGRLPIKGVVPLAPSFDTVGWMAADASIFARVASVLLASTAGFALEKLIWPEWLFAPLADKPAYRRAAEKLARLNGLSLTIDEHAPQWFDRLGSVFVRLQSFEVWQQFGCWFEAFDPQLPQDIAERLHAARDIAQPDSGDARNEAALLAVDVRQWVASFGPNAALVWPAADGLPPPIRMSPEERFAYRLGTLNVTAMASVGGLPQVVAPLVETRDMTIGLSLIGVPDSDCALVAAVTKGES